MMLEMRDAKQHSKHNRQYERRVSPHLKWESIAVHLSSAWQTKLSFIIVTLFCTTPESFIVHKSL